MMSARAKSWKTNIFISVLTTGFMSSGMILPGVAQVISDGTTNTTVNSIGNIFTILNGIDKGNNLFQSFSNFSIPTGGSAKFDLTNTPNITTIFSRVTGGNISKFNVNGKVDINNFGVDPNSGLIELPVNLTDPSQQIAAGCADTSGSSFIATGKGGIPQNPNQELRSDVYDGLRLRTWSDIRDISAYRTQQQVQTQIPQPSKTLIQATGWRRNPQGQVELIADKSINQTQQILTCAGISR